MSSQPKRQSKGKEPMSKKKSKNANISQKLTREIESRLDNFGEQHVSEVPRMPNPSITPTERYYRDCISNIIAPGSAPLSVFPTPDQSEYLDTRHFWLDTDVDQDYFIGGQNDIVVFVDPDPLSTLYVSEPGQTHPPGGPETGTITLRAINEHQGDGAITESDMVIKLATATWPGDSTAMLPTADFGAQSIIKVNGDNVWSDDTTISIKWLPGTPISTVRVKLQAHCDVIGWTPIGSSLLVANVGQIDELNFVNPGRTYDALNIRISSTDNVKKGTYALECILSGAHFSTGDGISNAFSIFNLEDIQRDLLGFSSMRVTAMSVLISYRGNDLNSGGQITGCRIEPGSFSSLNYDSTSELTSSILKLNPAYQKTGPSKDGMYGFWLPSLSETYPRPPTNFNTDLTRFIFVLSALNNPTSFHIHVDLCVEFKTESQFFRQIPSPIQTPLWNELQAVLRISPCFSHNPDHENMINRVKQIARGTIKTAGNFLLNNPQYVTRLLQLLLAM